MFPLLNSVPGGCGYCFENWPNDTLCSKCFRIKKALLEMLPENKPEPTAAGTAPIPEEDDAAAPAEFNALEITYVDKVIEVILLNSATKKKLSEKKTWDAFHGTSIIVGKDINRVRFSICMGQVRKLRLIKMQES